MCGKFARHNWILSNNYPIVKEPLLLGPRKIKEGMEEWKLLCEDLLQFLTQIDPGTTKLIANFLLYHNKAKLTLDKLNYEEGNLSRTEYLQSIRETVILEKRANKVLSGPI